MEFEFSSEQLALRDLAAKVIATSWPESMARGASVATELDRARWRELGELGLIGLGVPEELGGGGAGVVELQLVAEELGRSLAQTPFLAVAGLAVPVLLASGDVTLAQKLLPGVCAGESMLAVVATDRHGAWLPAVSGVSAHQDAAAWTLEGSAAHVLDGCDADQLLVLADESLFLVDVTQPGLSRTPMGSLDATRRQGVLDFAAVPARLVGAPGAGRQAVESGTDRAVALLAAEQLGTAERMLDLSVEYAKTRLQFGRPIGSFQAVKHRCADMLVQVEHARSAAYHAGWAFDAAVDDTRIAASLAHVACSQTAADVTAGAIQVHGGIGFTWEHAAHLYFKRSTADRHLFGGSPRHLERLAQLVIDAS
ncbi:acyl-CoA dehydrogenase family protein [Jatrophihabitans sp. GAS493]|uniref:acyl-CoA dehydrogenase family protein n=1 Tax=Jatrophihabitans sp. GAS493 TaxID=1907575 RepID=UPI0015611A43|nr:acyl-CoA dehydrogenase family protein [Jatrophihabitans sp. GAS493]